MKLFVSYARVDKSYCKQIVAELEDVHEVWWDKRLYIGQDWWQEIQDHIQWCDGLIYLLSPESVASEYCQREFELARSLGKHIFPVLLQARTEIPQSLQHLQYADLSDGLDNIRVLLNALTVVERTSRSNHGILPVFVTSNRSDSSDVANIQRLQEPRPIDNPEKSSVAASLSTKSNNREDTNLYLRSMRIITSVLFMTFQSFAANVFLLIALIIGFGRTISFGSSLVWIALLTAEFLLTSDGFARIKKEYVPITLGCTFLITFGSMLLLASTAGTEVFVYIGVFSVVAWLVFVLFPFFVSRTEFIGVLKSFISQVGSNLAAFLSDLEHAITRRLKR